MKKYIFTLIIASLATTVHCQFLKTENDLLTSKGFFISHYDESEDKLFLEVDKVDINFLFVHSLRTGLGSNDLGIDRGQLGGSDIVRFEKAGKKLLLVQPNLNYRAVTENRLEKKSIEEAFAKSIIFGFPIVDESNGKYLIDLTPFLMEDTHHIAATLKRAKQGTYKLDKSRSALSLERTKSFPNNAEFESIITFKGEATGSALRSVVPNSDAITVTQHYSFVKLPDGNYKPRNFDPRAGNIYTSFLDYATPVHEPIVQKLANRHRLIKKNPEAAVSEPVEPIIYYLDPGTPEPVRSALLEGASWWDEAFEAAGFKNAFQIKILPSDADPMDVRYNVIQWVHRSTRGWSYGASVTDPRTGEIIKGHVSLGSLRIRQDFLIAQALMNKPFDNANDNYQPMLDMALARIRQLSAHEVGHTLGFAHNFAASANGRASVMDYPHPTLTWDGKEVDFSNAYATGIGNWDKVTVKYSYGNPPKGISEKAYLNAILLEAEKDGLRYITDSDARAQGGAHFKAHLWDNGKSPSEELDKLLVLRKGAIANFSIDNIRSGETYSTLEDVFVPLYFYHRYQTEATIKMIGGMEYNYAVKDDPYINNFSNLKSSQQQNALDVVLKTLAAEELAIPKEKLSLFPPRAHGNYRTRESFKSNLGVAFDPLGAAATASDMTLNLLLHPERANRMVYQKALNKNQIGLKGLLSQLVDKTLFLKYDDAYHQEVQKSINNNVIKNIKSLSVHPNAMAQTKAIAMAQLKNIKTKLSSFKTDAYSMFIIDEIDLFLKNPDKFEAISSPKIPDGSPIGCFE